VADSLSGLLAPPRCLATPPVPTSGPAGEVTRDRGHEIR
jgi:hypothetical protein